MRRAGWVTLRRAQEVKGFPKMTMGERDETARQAAAGAIGAEEGLRWADAGNGRRAQEWKREMSAGRELEDQRQQRHDRRDDQHLPVPLPRRKQC